MQDCFTEGFFLFNRWEIAHDVQGAVAINGATNSIIMVAVSWSGSWWRDRFGGRQMVLYTSLIPTAVELALDVKVILTLPCIFH